MAIVISLSFAEELSLSRLLGDERTIWCSHELPSSVSEKALEIAKKEGVHRSNQFLAMEDLKFRGMRPTKASLVQKLIVEALVGRGFLTPEGVAIEREPVAGKPPTDLTKARKGPSLLDQYEERVASDRSSKKSTKSAKRR